MATAADSAQWEFEYVFIVSGGINTNQIENIVQQTYPVYAIYVAC